MEIEKLFSRFLEESAQQDSDIEYCLLQSSVEPTIRFKFGSWLNKSFGDRIHLNLMEANRLDLVVGIDDHVYFIEFGHMLNLLQHGANFNNWKVESDKKKIKDKVEKMVAKIEKMKKCDYNHYFLGKKKIYALCSLFSDVKVKVNPNNEAYETSIGISSLNSGTLFKYGKLFSYKKSKEYFENYSSHLNKEYSPEELTYPTGYKEVCIIPEKLSLHYKFDFLEEEV